MADAHAAQGLRDQRGEIAGLLQRFRRRFAHLAPLLRQHNHGDRHEDQDQHREPRIHIEHGADQNDHFQRILSEGDDRPARRGADEIGVVEEARQQPPRMHRLDPAEIGLGELAEHLDAQVGDEPVAEIGHGDVGNVFGDGLQHRDDDDRGGDPDDHVLLLGDEHVVRRALDQEGDGAGGGRREQHGHGGDSQEPGARAQMLGPDALDDVQRRVIDGKLVGAPGDRACVSEYLIFQAFSRSMRARRRSQSPAVPLLAWASVRL
jgi:hypothetical protein